MDLEETARKIESMDIRGAAKIARAAASALKSFAMDYDGSDIKQFRDELKMAASRLISTRPTAVSLRNAVSIVLKGADSAEDLVMARKNIATRAEEFITNSEKALNTIAEIGSKRIKENDILLTHCNSSAALSTIIKAHKDGKNIEVYATESRPKRQGYITIRQLVDEGVPTTLIVDSAVRHVMPNVDLVIVGADTVASNGDVINKIGTSQIALCAHEARVPVMVCAETYKFSAETLTGEIVKIEERDVNEIVRQKDFPKVRIFNPVFDVTPPEYVDVIVTEKGVISPYAAYEIIKSLNSDS
ncbi:MAG: ribose 1,5-bisphosphate isomerase [Methanomassiliicoccales archaeon]|nr:MAG: ribose 1,5-bisphosphate isomerase [Methanomassiliicoccales archaeon]